MTRIVKKHGERLDELLKTSMALFSSKGYDNTSVNDIITAVGIAKGTFYYYFKSKEDLLNALIETFAAQIAEKLEVIASDQSLDAIAKLNRFFVDAGNYKLENKETVKLAAMVFYREENLLMREKLMKRFIAQADVMLTRIIMQGVAEKVFTTAFGAHAALLLVHMMLFLRDDFSEKILQPVISRESVNETVERCMMCQDAIERILGAPPGSVQIFTRELIKGFFE
jgi:AcrR family transcriptional regulator